MKSPRNLKYQGFMSRRKMNADFGRILDAKSDGRTSELHKRDQGTLASISTKSAVQEIDKNSIITEMTILNVRGRHCKSNLNGWIEAKIHH